MVVTLGKTKINVLLSISLFHQRSTLPLGFSQRYHRI